MTGRTTVGSDASSLIRTLTVTVFLLWMGATSIVPMLPVYIRNLGGSDLLAGLVMASFFAAGVLSQYPMGRLADRIGRRPVLLFGLVLYAAASFAFLFRTAPALAVLLRGAQGVGAGAAAIAALAMVSGAVAVERRGRAFASVISAEIAGMAVGPLVGAIVGVHHMWLVFLASGVVALAAVIPASRIVEPAGDRPASMGSAPSGGPAHRLARLRWNRSLTGALVASAALGLTTGVYDICWTLLLVSRGAAGWQIGVSWTMFAVPFVLAARPSGWLADHLDRRVLVLGGLGLACLFCASYPFIHSVPWLMTLGGLEALGFAAAMPSLQSLLTQGSDPSEVGRVQGLFGTTQTAMTAVSAAAAGAAFAVAPWIPFVSVSICTLAALGAAGVVWRSVAGHVTTPALLEMSEEPDTGSAPADSDVGLPAGRPDGGSGVVPVAQTASAGAPPA